MASDPAALAAHPAAPPRVQVAAAAAATLDARGLVLRFVLRAATGALLVAPRAARPGRRDRLWEHTCCEAFVGTPGGDAYLELNLAPSGDWALWAFDGCRAGMRAAATVAPRLRVIHAADELRVDAILDASAVHAFLGAPPWEVGLAVVVEEPGGHRSYFAAVHTGERPDFHARAARCVVVYPPRGA
jgi:hypothetical protein